MQLKWGSPCSFLCNLDGYYSKYMTHEVSIRNPGNPSGQLSFQEKLISCIEILKQFNKTDYVSSTMKYEFLQHSNKNISKYSFKLFFKIA